MWFSNQNALVFRVTRSSRTQIQARRQAVEGSTVIMRSGHRLVATVTRSDLKDAVSLASEDELDRQLGATCVVRLVGDVGYLPEVGVCWRRDHSSGARVAGRSGEPRVIEGVSKLGLELDAHPFVDPCA